MSGDFFQVGVVAGVVGLKGEIRVFPTTDDPSRFLDLREVYINGENLYTIQSCRINKGLAVLKLAGVETAEAAAALKGQPLTIPPEWALPLEDGQYYHRDLLDMRVFDETGAELGILTKIIPTGANDVYAVTGPDGKDWLIPAVKAFVSHVDVPNKRMTIRNMAGLSDLRV